MRTSANLPLLDFQDEELNAISGAVSLSVSGQNGTGAGLPCAVPGGCWVNARLPLFDPSGAAPTAPGRRLLSPAASTLTAEQLVCLRMSIDTTFDADTACCSVTAVQPTAATATAIVKCGGTFILGALPGVRYTPLDPPAASPAAASPSPSPSPAASPAAATPANTAAAASPEPAPQASPSPPAGTNPFEFVVRFVGADYDALVANASALEAFKESARAQVAAATSKAANAPLDASNVVVAGVSKGSVVADIMLHLPEEWSARQVTGVARLITHKPANVFSASFLKALGATSITVTISPSTPLPPREPVPPGTVAGAVIGSVAGAALLIGGAAFLFMRQRRRRASMRYAASAEEASLA